MSKKITQVFILEQVTKSIRDFFHSRGFHEVLIPIFNKTLPLEPNLYAVKAGKYYLPTSPEATLKKMIAKGLGNCFAIGATFRDLEGKSLIHKPEFLMLEWYRSGVSYKEIMKETRELVQFVFRHSREGGNPDLINKEWIPHQVRDDRILHEDWPILSMEELFKKYAKLDLEELCHSWLDQESRGIPHQVRDDNLSRIAERGYTIQNATWEQIFNQIFLNEIEKYLPKEPFFLTDYPARISPLCARKRDKPYLAQRFELYINGIEIANGNTENTDAESILRGMKKEEKYRKKAGILSPPIDMKFIEALRKMQGKSYAGIGMGVERLCMLLSGIKDIKQLT